MTVKERLHQLVDTLPEAEACVIERMLRGLQATAQEPEAAPGAEDPFYVRLGEMGIEFTPANPDPDRWAEPLPDLPGVDLSGAVLEEREEALRRWD